MIRRGRGGAAPGLGPDLGRAMAETAPEPAETIPVQSREVACDGGDGPLGHPRVYLNMGDQPAIDCPYCGRHYVFQPGDADR